MDFISDRLNRRAAAAYVGLTPAALEADVTTKRLRIPRYRIGNRIYYRKSDLDHWIEQRRISCGSLGEKFSTAHKHQTVSIGNNRGTPAEEATDAAA